MIISFQIPFVFVLSYLIGKLLGIVKGIFVRIRIQMGFIRIYPS